MSGLREKLVATFTPEKVQRMHAAYFDPATSSDERTRLRLVLEAVGRPVPAPTAASAVPIVAAALSAGKFTAAEAPYFGSMLEGDFESAARAIERLPGRVETPPVAPVVLSAPTAPGDPYAGDLEWMGLGDDD